jgi:hypothetical protein
MIIARYKSILPKPHREIDRYRFWVNGKGYYNFNTFKVYNAYRWTLAENVDYYNSITPIKKQWGYEIDKTNYAERYNN